jgi:hypothetical protein
MIFIIGIITFFIGFYFCYFAYENYKIFKNGALKTAKVTEIEKIVSIDEEDGKELISYYLHLELPDYLGLNLGVRYDQTKFDFRKYKVGDFVEILQDKDQPLDLFILKEMTYLDIPKYCLFLGLFLLLISYFSCYHS